MDVKFIPYYVLILIITKVVIMTDFNWVDYVIIAILFFSVLAGFARGIVKELLSLITWIIAFVASSLFASKLASVFTSTAAVQTVITDTSNSVGASAAEPISMLSLGLSFVSIFLVVLVIGSLISYVVSGAVDRVGLGVVNRVFGAIFGFVRGFLINLVLIFIVQLTSFEQETWWQQSKLVPSYQPAINWISTLVDPNFQSIKNKMNGTIEQTAQSLIKNIYQYRG